MPRIFGFGSTLVVCFGLALSCRSLPRDWYRARGFRPTCRLPVRITNPLPVARPAAAAMLKRNELPALIRQAPRICLVDPGSAGPEGNGHKGKVLPSQLDDLDGDGDWDEVAFQIDLGPGETRKVHLYGYSSPEKDVFPSGVRALVCQTHNLKQLVLESARITYTVYEAAALDAIGKSSPGFNSDFFFGAKKRSPNLVRFEKHGLDFIPVGTTMGAASFCILENPARPEKYERPWTANSLFLSSRGLPAGGALFHFKILANGPVRAIGKAEVTRWKSGASDYECELTYTLWAHQRHIQIDLALTKVHTASPDFSLALGFRKIENETFFKSTPSFTIATVRDIFSVASGDVVADLAGLALIHRPEDYAGSALSKDDARSQNHLVMLKGRGRRRARFYAWAAWNKDSAVQSSQQWEHAVQTLSTRLFYPPATEAGSLEGTGKAVP